MGFFDFLGSFKGGFVTLTSYIWVLYIFVPIALLVFGGYIWKMSRDKKKQWTHNLIVRRELSTGLLSKPAIIRMKRFPLVSNASVFQLEKPFLGSYLIPELDSYTGTNEFSVIIDNSNRIYINKGEKFDKEAGSVNVSAKHAGIDLAFEDLKSDWININKVDKKVEWKDIAKFMMFGLLIIAVMIVSIKGIGQWGENHQIDAERAASQAEAMRQLSEAMETSQATMNVALLVLDLFKSEEIYGTNNIQGIIREKTNATVS